MGILAGLGTSCSLGARTVGKWFSCKLTAYSLAVCACMQIGHALPIPLYRIRGYLLPEVESSKDTPWKILDLIV